MANTSNLCMYSPMLPLTREASTHFPVGSVAQNPSTLCSQSHYQLLGFTLSWNLLDILPGNWLKIDCIPKQNLDFLEQTFKGSGIHLFQTSYFYRWEDNTQTNAVTGSKCLQLGTCARARGRSQPSFAISVFFSLCFCILNIHLNL